MAVKCITGVMETHIPDGIAKLVAMVLADYADPLTAQCWPKIATLARQCSQSERTVQRKIRVLEELGLLDILPNASGNRKGNVYVLHLRGLAAAATGDRIDRDGAPAGTGDPVSPVAMDVPEGVTEGHPRGDSAVTRGVTLQSPQESVRESSSESPPLPPAGGRSASRHRNRGEEAVGGFRAGLARIEPERRQPRPDEPAPGLDPPTQDGFARLWTAFPEAGRIDCDRPAAEKLFAGLSGEDRVLAIAAAARYAVHVQHHQARPKALHGWLRHQRFRNVAASGSGTAAADGASRAARVFVREDSPEWGDWEEHARRQGRVPHQPSWSESERAMGWWFPSARPPQAALA